MKQIKLFVLIDHRNRWQVFFLHTEKNTCNYQFCTYWCLFCVWPWNTWSRAVKVFSKEAMTAPQGSPPALCSQWHPLQPPLAASPPPALSPREPVVYLLCCICCSFFPSFMGPIRIRLWTLPFVESWCRSHPLWLSQGALPSPASLFFPYLQQKSL